MGKRAGDRAAFGDYQTPVELAQLVCGLLKRVGERPATILEPTCGEGSFLAAAARIFPDANLVGRDISDAYVRRTRSRLDAEEERLDLATADFFKISWRSEFASRAKPLLVLGNPPWVTTSDLSVLEVANAPKKSNIKGLSGLDSQTGKSNFDISEWMLIHLLESLQGCDASIAMLVKTSVARKVIQYAAGRELIFSDASMRRVDAGTHFDVAVDACLFYFSPRGGRRYECRVYSSLEAREPEYTIGVRDQILVADVPSYDAVASVLGATDPPWRSGVKHDCARVMELRRTASGLKNGLGEVADVEDDCVFPLLKSSDLARGRTETDRFVIVTQRRLGQDTKFLQQTAPKTWSYLERHGERLDVRKSVIYRTQPRFAMFGVGDYSFTPWKVGIAGLYKSAVFTLVGQGGKPVMLDDTCYFLGFDQPDVAAAVQRLFSGELGQRVVRAFTFWDAKRPINKDILSRLDIRKLAAAELRSGAGGSQADVLRRLATSTGKSDVSQWTMFA